MSIRRLIYNIVLKQSETKIERGRSVFITPPHFVPISHYLMPT